MTLKDYALYLRNKLGKKPSEEKILEIVNDINTKTDINGNLLSNKTKEKILAYIENPNLDEEHIVVCESDNSALLDAISIIRSKVKGGK